jgi:16S rRNA (cytidine1402-2'-O)-methyltransferase
LISEAGLPLISDPGYLLTKTVIKKNLPYTVIPGPTALTTALIHSGFNPENFIFLGFLPKRTSELLRFNIKLKQLKSILPDLVFICYESPNRINKTLQLLDQDFPNIDVCVCRELTKKFEEIIRGKPKDLMERKFKGEITLLLSW